jgi:predicted Rossmann fold nucleotide-binding protein DprA/Smf involved in DNA uptake
MKTNGLTLDERIELFLDFHPTGITVADLCEEYALKIQSVSTALTKLERIGVVKIVGKARSQATGSTGKLWALV